MQSIVTILLAGCAACLAMFMMPPQPTTNDQLYALEITLEENGERFVAQKVVVEPGQTYVIDLEAGAEYDLAINIPQTTTRAVADPFAVESEGETAEFLKFNADLSVDGENETATLSDYGAMIASNLFLSLAEPAREIRSIIPLSGQQVFTRSGQPVESLAIMIKGVPVPG